MNTSIFFAMLFSYNVQLLILYFNKKHTAGFYQLSSVKNVYCCFIRFFFFDSRYIYKLQGAFKDRPYRLKIIHFKHQISTISNRQASVPDKTSVILSEQRVLKHTKCRAVKTDAEYTGGGVDA